MWRMAFVISAAAWSPAVGAAASNAGPCLSSGDAANAVTSRKVLPASQAIVMARRAVPDAQVLRASLCGEPGSLVYRITVLHRDGRLVRVTVDAPSGKLKGVR